MRLVLAIIVSVTVCCGLVGQRPRDEVRDFFGKVRPLPTKKQAEEIKALWRKAQIGGRNDRLQARVELMIFDDMATAFLEARLSSGSAADVRTSSLILGRIGDESVAGRIRRLLFDSNKTVVARRHLALALGLLGGPRDVLPLAKLLKDNRRNGLRRAIVFALGQLKGQEAVAELINQYHKDNAQAFRRAVVFALGSIGGPDAKTLIKKSLKSSKESVRRSATLAAAELRDPTLIPEFRRRLKDSDDQVILHALIGLGLLKDPQVALAIKKAGILRSTKAEFRALAVTALGMQDDEVSLQLLKDRGKSKLERHALVRRALAFALKRRPGAMTKAAKKRLYADRDPDVGRALWCTTALRPQKTSGILLEKAIFAPRLHDHIRLTLLDLLVYHDPAHGDLVLRKILDERRFKKAILVRSAELLGILERGGEIQRTQMRARIQVEVDELGGSPEWNLLQAKHQQFLSIENIVRPLTSPGGGNKPGGQQNRPDLWTNENEDLRLWFDRHPYSDRRLVMDVFL